MSYSKHLPTLLINQNRQCHYCGVDIEHVTNNSLQKKFRRNRATVDHIKAKYNGGDDQLDNLVAACNQCNSVKGHLEYTNFLSILSLSDIEFNKFLQKNRNIREKKTKNKINGTMEMKKNLWEQSLKSCRSRRIKNGL